MKILLCIDDTDAIGTKGTGYLAENIKRNIQQTGGKAAFISRHQLYVHKDVPYTSHNSAMCFEADIPQEQLGDTISMAQKMLIELSAEGSDPGLCVAIKDAIPDPASLIRYGRSAKCSILTKEQAYDHAKSQGIHLSEHGGTGQGIIGALAGVGLRLFGHDGRVKGKAKTGKDAQTITAKELKAITGFSNVICIDGKKIQDDQSIVLTEGEVKAVFLNWESTVIVVMDKALGTYRTLNKEQAKCY